MRAAFTLHACAASALFVASPAIAESATADMTVSAEVRNHCSVAASAMAFPVTDIYRSASIHTNIDGQGQVQVNCNAVTPFQVAIDHGINAVGSQRHLVNDTGGQLAYDVYSDAQRSTVWDGNDHRVTAQSTGTGTSQFTVFGRIAIIPSETVSGVYSDTLTVSIEF